MSNIRHGEKLKELREEKGLSVEELAMNLGLSLPNTYKYFKFGQSGALEKNRFSKAMIAYICLLFNQSPEVFGEDESLFQLRKKDGEIIPTEWPNLFFGASSDWGKDHDLFLKTYFEAIGRQLEKAQYSYQVYDCFSNNYGASHSTNAGEYFRHHQSYFAQIERVLSSDRGASFRYQRIAALPPRRERLNDDDTLHSVITLMFQETFEHLLRCYHNYPDQFSFYVVEPLKSPRKYTYGLIDDGQTIISEYDLYQDGIARPDILFVEQQSGPNASWTKELASVYRQEIEQLTNLLNLVTLHDFRTAVYQAQVREKQNISDLKRQQALLTELSDQNTGEVVALIARLEGILNDELKFAEYRLLKTIEPKVEFLKEMESKR